MVQGGIASRIASVHEAPRTSVFDLRDDADLMLALRDAIHQIHRQLRQMRRDLDTLAPWLALVDEPAARAIALPAQLRLDEIPTVAERLIGELVAWRDDQHRRAQLTPEQGASAQRLVDALGRSRDGATALHAELVGLAARADDEVRDMDFRLLYDAERKLFRIGYNVSTWIRASRATTRSACDSGRARSM
jgi:hypothetical protein